MYSTLDSIKLAFTFDGKLFAAVFSNSFPGSGILQYTTNDEPPTVVVLNGSQADLLKELKETYKLDMEGQWPSLPKPKEPTWLEKAGDEAADMADHFLDTIIEALMSYGEASKRLDSYRGGDSYHHETHVDHYYSFDEAVEVIKALSDYEETEKSLWDGQDIKEAVSTCAAYTYGNAVLVRFEELVDRINDRFGEEEFQEDEKKKVRTLVKTVIAGFR